MNAFWHIVFQTKRKLEHVISDVYTDLKKLSQVWSVRNSKKYHGEIIKPCKTYSASPNFK